MGSEATYRFVRDGVDSLNVMWMLSLEHQSRDPHLLSLPHLPDKAGFGTFDKHPADISMHTTIVQRRPTRWSLRGWWYAPRAR